MKHVSSKEPKISVLLHYAPSAINSEYLELAAKCYKQNTTNPYELLIIDEAGDQYELLNQHIDLCQSNLIVLSGVEYIPCKGWDIPYINNYDDGTILTQFLIEPGAPSAAPENHQKIFGWCPRCFRRDEFEAYAAKITHRYKNWKADGGCLVPSCIPKGIFKYGKFEHPQIMMPTELQFINKMKKEGIRVKRCESVWYHFQKAKCKCWPQT